MGRQAETPAIRASSVGSNGNAAMHNRDGCAPRPAPPLVKLRHGFAQREPRRQGAGFDDNAVGRSSVDEQGRDELNSPCAKNCMFQIGTDRGEHFVFWNGGEGEPTGRERKPIVLCVYFLRQSGRRGDLR